MCLSKLSEYALTICAFCGIQILHKRKTINKYLSLVNFVHIDVLRKKYTAVYSLL